MLETKAKQGTMMRKMNFSSFYLVGAFVGYLEGLGQPIIILWSINSMFNVSKATQETIKKCEWNATRAYAEK